MFVLLPFGDRFWFVVFVGAFLALMAADIRSRIMKTWRPEFDLAHFIAYFSKRGIEADISTAVYEFFADLAFAPTPRDGLKFVYGFSSHRADEIFAEIAGSCGISLPVHWFRSNPVPLEAVSDIIVGLSYYRRTPSRIWLLRTARWFRNAALAARPFVQLAVVVASAAILLTQFDSNPQIDCLAFSPDGTTLAAGGGLRRDNGNGSDPVSGLIWTFDVAGGKLKRRTVYPGDDVIWLSYSPHGRELACLQDDGPYHLQDSISGRANGDVIVNTPYFPIATAKRWLTMVDVADWDESPAGRSRLSQSPDRSVLAVSADDKLTAVLKFPQNTIEIRDVPRNKLLQNIGAQAQGATAGSTAFSPDDRLLAFAWKSTPAGIEYALWNLRTHKTQINFKSRTRACNQLVFSHNGKLIALADDSGNIELWNVASGQCLRRIKVY